MILLVAGLAVGLYLLFFIIRLLVTATVKENSTGCSKPASPDRSPAGQGRAGRVGQ